MPMQPKEIDFGEIERAACHALGLVHESNVGEQGAGLTLSLGTFKISENVAAYETAEQLFEKLLFDTCAAAVRGLTKTGYERSRSFVQRCPLMEADGYKIVLAKENEERGISLSREVVPSEEERLLLPYREYILGQERRFWAFIDKPVAAYYPEDHCRRNTYVVGTIGSGKTELIKAMMYGYVEQPRSAAVVAIDPAGDFVDEVAGWPEFVGNDRLVFLKLDLQSGMVPTINPFEMSGIDPDDHRREMMNSKRIASQQLIGALQEIIAEGVGSQVTIPMRAILRPCVLTLLDRKGSTLRDLERFMHDDRELIDFAVVASIMILRMSASSGTTIVMGRTNRRRRRSTSDCVICWQRAFLPS